MPAGIGSLFVIASATSHSYAGRMVDPRQLGQERGLRYVLNGSTHRAGSRLRITTQLSDTAVPPRQWPWRSRRRGAGGGFDHRNPPPALSAQAMTIAERSRRRAAHG
ncbi:hypothetical protein ACFQU2_36280 [Siccirubricoccus deserti]